MTPLRRSAFWLVSPKPRSDSERGRSRSLGARGDRRTRRLLCTSAGLQRPHPGCSSALVIAVDVVSALYVITVRDAAIIISRVRQHPVRDGPIAVLALSDSELEAWVRAKV